MHHIDDENIEMDLLLDAIYRKYGYDFRGYSRASLKRRIRHRLSLSGLASISALQGEIIYNVQIFNDLLQDMSINVTEMFRDHLFYTALREHVLPELAHLDRIKIWHAGCSSGEEVYSMCILLQEAGLYEKTQIYATDFDEVILKKAKEGVYSINHLRAYEENYYKSGGTRCFTEYYSRAYDLARMNSDLKERVLFSRHNLVCDGVFSEVDLVVCRNVLIYFNRDLQDTVFKLFTKSLSNKGVLCIGPKETIRLSSESSCFEDIVKDEKIYRKIFYE